MKQFIVFIAIFPFMMAFMLQFTAQQSLDIRMDRIDDAVYAAREQAKSDGCFTDGNLSGLRSAIADAAGCAEESVQISADRDVKYRTGRFDEREMINCTIKVPLRDLMAMPGFFGINGSENSACYTINETFPSEKLL